MTINRTLVFISPCHIAAIYQLKYSNHAYPYSYLYACLKRRYCGLMLQCWHAMMPNCAWLWHDLSDLASSQIHVYGTESNSEERRDYVVGMRHLPDELAAGSHGPIFHNRPQPNIMQYRSSSPPVCVWIQTETATEKIKTEEKMWHRDQSTRWDQSAKLF
jgi:hypothetical protein